MAQSTIQNVRFAGMATCVPRWIISNIDDCPPDERSERERLIRNIGIHTRRLCADWQCFSDLAFEAAEVLLESLSWEKEEVDALIVVSQSPDYLIPSTAIILQDRLKLKTSTIAFDVNLGCSGYPFGIHLLASMISSGGIKKALLLVGDRCATLEGPIFSDAGTATALEFDAGAPPIYFDLNSDGSGYQSIMLPVGGHREPFAFYHFMPIEDEKEGQKKTSLFSNKRKKNYSSDLIMDGTGVLNFSTQKVPTAVENILDNAGLNKNDISYYIFHQANRMINETIRKKLQLTPDVVPSSLHDFGNSSGASLPVTMTVRIREQLERQANKVLLCGFGIGLSWGTCILDIEKGTFPELVISKS
jgi:3-oxoacyl-[acyl-carrier-protein] synthase-3